MHSSCILCLRNVGIDDARPSRHAAMDYTRAAKAVTNQLRRIRNARAI
jgi:hypothetical protein